MAAAPKNIATAPTPDFINNPNPRAAAPNTSSAPPKAITVAILIPFIRFNAPAKGINAVASRIMDTAPFITAGFPR